MHLKVSCGSLKANLDPRKSILEIPTAHAHFKIPSDILQHQWIRLWKASDWMDFDESAFQAELSMSLNWPLPFSSSQRLYQLEHSNLVVICCHFAYSLAPSRIAE